MPKLRDIAGGNSGTTDTRAKRVIRPVNSHVIGGSGAVASSTSTVGVPPARIPETGPWIGVEGFDFLFDTSDESNLTLGAGDTIQSWVDSSGNRTLATSPYAGTNEPTLDSVNTLNGYSGISFDRTSNNMLVDTNSFAFDINVDSHAFFFVASIGASSSGLGHFTDAGGNNAQAVFGMEYAGSGLDKINYSTNGSFSGTSTNNREGGDVSENTPVRLLYAWDGTNIIMRAEGLSEVVDPSGASIRPPAARFALGARRSNTPAFFFNGIVYAFVGYYNHAACTDSAVRQQIWDNLGARYGL